MIFENLCTPAIVYLVFSLTHIVLDIMKGMYNTAFMKVWVAGIFTLLLNFLCSQGLGVVSWIIVFIPFILMTVIVALLLLFFGLDPSTGKLKNQLDENVKPEPDIRQQEIMKREQEQREKKEMEEVNNGLKPMTASSSFTFDM